MAFREIKRLVQGAVDFFVMDVDGAQTGSNPLYLLPDACKYAAGLGLMQHAPRPRVEEGAAPRQHSPLPPPLASGAAIPNCAPRP